ncbi:hypothetical protein MTR67_007326 [Solanum verrucosum]|uniref:RNase H type-1 domain-containing protein n=1 Tax=Solanum verrucosum TaxID=315347 RepID=A0AAF0TCN2_SOLVR|nr:hypothetical protein MTR67_007326 [Solanum verrucosum]
MYPPELPSFSQPHPSGTWPEYVGSLEEVGVTSTSVFSSHKIRELKHCACDVKTVFPSAGGHKGSIKKIMAVLNKYEKISGQLINLTKSYMYFHEKVSIAVRNRIRRTTRIGVGSFPFTYLGCPMFYGRKKICHFEELVKKVSRRVMAWHSRLLTYGGKYVLVCNVLQSMPIYLMSAMNPPKGVINQIQKIMAKFFWGKVGSLKGKHWVAWDDLCLPKAEGGIGLRSLHTVADSLFAKLWWNFRTSSDSLWSHYMWNKYCKKQHPVIAQGTGISHVWRKMIQIREEVEHNIWWQVKAGEASFWFDNWTKQGALYYLEEQNHGEEEIEVKQFIQERRWNKGKLNQYVSEEMVQYITENISPVLIETGKDKAWWMGSTTGNFTVKSAWDLLRHRRDEREILKFIWNKGIPFRINFFLWRAPSKVMEIYKVIPALITWTLWKRRNSRKHGGDISLQNMISQVLQNVQFILKKKFPWIEMRGQNWEEMIRRLGANKSRLYHCIVRWDAPHEDVIKCNTDGASKGNPGISAYGYCLRNSNGDLIHAAAENIGITTNVEAEMRAILEAIRYCVNKKMRKIILESDSLLMIKIINEAWKVPWVIAEEFDELK